MTYNEQYAHPRDAEISFEPESHTYLWRGRELKSVTTVVEDCFEKFDAEATARRMRPDDPAAAQALMDEWEARGREARDLGTLIHDRIERHYLGELIEPEAEEDPTFRLFRAFTSQRKLRPYRTEWRIYMEECGLAGTLDFLGVDRMGEFELWDWKRSSKLVDKSHRAIVTSDYNKTAYAPVDYLPDTAYWHYALQLSIYRLILAVKYKIHVSHSHLGVFHPDNGCYHVIDVPYLPNAVSKILRNLKR